MIPPRHPSEGSSRALITDQGVKVSKILLQGISPRGCNPSFYLQRVALFYYNQELRTDVSLSD